MTRHRPPESLACQDDPTCTYLASGDHYSDARGARRVCWRHRQADGEPLTLDCPRCGGSGEVDTTPPGTAHPANYSTGPCPECAGWGMITSTRAADLTFLPDPVTL